MLDWKLIGYSISSISVLLLGAAGWPGDRTCGVESAGADRRNGGLDHGHDVPRIFAPAGKAAIAYAKREAEKH